GGEHSDAEDRMKMQCGSSCELGGDAEAGEVAEFQLVSRNREVNFETAVDKAALWCWAGNGRAVGGAELEESECAGGGETGRWGESRGGGYRRQLGRAL